MRVILLTFAKTALSFLVLWGTTRLLGKRQISQITYFDYITGITIGSLAANLITPEDDWRALLTGLVAWGALTSLFHWLSLKGKWLRRILDGEATIMLEHGQVLDKNLAKAQMNVQELMAMLRARGYFNPAVIEFAQLETNGELSILPRSQHRTVQPRDLHLDTDYEGLPLQVMHERQPMPEALKKLGRDEDWLYAELRKQGHDDPNKIFAAWLTTTGSFVVTHYQQAADDA